MLKIMLAAAPKCHYVDLDGTLAKEGPDAGLPLAWSPLAIGDPVPAMVNRVKGWLKAGDTVVIFTARVGCIPESDPMQKMQVTMAIQAWCQKNLGQILEITAMKSDRATDYWDDRNVAVERNTGKPLSDPGGVYQSAVHANK